MGENEPGHLLTITDGPFRSIAADSEQFMPRGWFATRGIVGDRTTLQRFSHFHAGSALHVLIQPGR